MSILKAPPGSLTVICGSMFSGKTEELIRLVRRAMHARKRVQVFKSAMDTRCDTTVIRTHDGMTFTALAVPDSRAMEGLLEPDVQIVGIEEVQFFDDGVVALCQRLADRGVEVIAAGLDQDFRGMPFSFMPQLMALADNVMKLHAICKVCGQDASRTQRLVNGTPRRVGTSRRFWWARTRVTKPAAAAAIKCAIFRPPFARPLREREKQSPCLRSMVQAQNAVRSPMARTNTPRTAKTAKMEVKEAVQGAMKTSWICFLNCRQAERLEADDYSIASPPSRRFAAQEGRCHGRSAKL